jgi:hypothetical protein
MAMFFVMVSKKPSPIIKPIIMYSTDTAKKAMKGISQFL